MLSEISKKRLKYLGHANRNTKADLMTTVLQGKLEAKRNQGRPPTSYIDNVKADSGLQLYEVIHHSRDRDRWRPVVEKSGAPMDGHGHGDR
jgi:glucose-6-phosphate 1-dehydrogenase